MWNKIRNILIIIFVTGVLVTGYIFFVQKPEQEPLASTTTQQGELAQVSADETTKLSQDFLSLLFSVKSIYLDTAVFDTPTFGSLKDSSIILIPDGSEGRPNPFAPIGIENSFTSNQSTVELLQIPEPAKVQTTAPAIEKDSNTPTVPKKTN